MKNVMLVLVVGFMSSSAFAEVGENKGNEVNCTDIVAAVQSQAKAAGVDSSTVKPTDENTGTTSVE